MTTLGEQRYNKISKLVNDKINEEKDKAKKELQFYLIDKVENPTDIEEEYLFETLYEGNDKLYFKYTFKNNMINILEEMYERVDINKYKGVCKNPESVFYGKSYEINCKYSNYDYSYLSDVNLILFL